MQDGFKGFDLMNELIVKNEEFKKKINYYMACGLIRTFDEFEWEKIRSQNFISPIPDMKNFYDMFVLGYNKGNCIGASRQLSYSYDDVDLVAGTLPILVGTLNAEKVGGHGWIETFDKIIDTSLLLVIDKSLRDEIGYVEEKRITAFELSMSD